MNLSKILKNKISLEKYAPIIFQVLAWALIFKFPYIFNSPELEVKMEKDHDNDANDFLYLNTITKIYWVFIFYVNTIKLIPSLIYRKKYLLFVLAQLMLFALIMFLHLTFFHQYFFEWLTGRTSNIKASFSYIIVPFLFTLIVSIAYKTITDRTKSEKEASEKQKENLKTELSFLRSQISPHFLFNVLNNMVAMARLNKENLEESLIKLSSILKYMLYETDEEKVLLKSEINYIKSYIDLQSQRYSQKLKLKIDLNVNEDWHAIEPMLLIPFIENAFKHGYGLIKEPVIEVGLKTQNGKMHFEVKNKYLDSDGTKDKDSGIGLANVKRRLELLYPKRHDLKIEKTDEWFIVNLTLEFNDELYRH